MRQSIENIETALGFDEILAAVGDNAASEMGRERVIAARPTPEAKKAQDAMALVHEWTGLLTRNIDPPMSGIADIRASIETASVVGSMLDGESLRDVGSFASAADALLRYFSDHRDATPGLWKIASQILPTPQSQKEISRSIAPNGSVLDAASPDLRRIRRALAGMDGKITSMLSRMASKLSADGVLTDDFHTQRNGRYVLPVRAGAKGKVQGIVHDASNTGQTFFIEPIAVVELSNELTNLQLEEAEEVRRVLAALTEVVFSEITAFKLNLDIAPRLDAIYARARFGVVNDCAIPQIIDGASIDLRKAHHPLLHLHQRDRSIPVAVRLDPDDHTLAISGPNAGGKTTMLKSIGLHCMMAQCAIPAPLAPNSVLPVFSRFFADIGDDQDVEAGVSTFSSHIRAIREITERADERSLVLLDELGTATDPLEGGSLAVAIAERLCGQAALTVITSHLSVLKHWAHEEPRARNASFRLDDDTHQPSFVMTMDVPGTSEALVVAEQQGLDAGLIERAREILPPGEEDVSSLILSLQRKNEESDAMRRELDEQVEQMEVDREKYQRLYDQYREERRDFKRDLLEEKKKSVAAARADVERRIANLPSKHDLTRARDELKVAQREVVEEIEELTPEPEPVDPNAIVEGGAVEVAGMSEPGLVLRLEADRGRAQVRVGVLTMEFPLSKLTPCDAARSNQVRDAHTPSKQRRKSVRVKRSDSGFTSEIELHGLYVDEAIERVDQYLSDAAVNDWKRIKLRHGVGTGRLRTGIHEYIRTHPLVRKFHSALPEEGGKGVTVVELR